MLKLKRLKTLTCLLLVLAALLMPVCAAEPPAITSAAAILYEVKSDEILFEYNADVQRYPASTTIYSCKLLEDGSPEDLPQDEIDTLTEMGWTID